MNAPLLSVEHLTVDLTVPTGMLHAVRDVSFTVGSEQTLALVGESGCGKTMTALALMGLLPKQAKRLATRIDFGGQDLLGLDEPQMSSLRGNRISMIFQDATSALNPVFRIGTQLEDVYLRHRGGTRRAAGGRAHSLLDRLGINSPELRLRQYPHELSGGMRQRVMIAMALMCEPKLVIADEPTTALDATVQAQILNLLLDIQREMKLAIVLIAHDLGIVANIANTVAVMYAGAIVESGAVRDVFERPQHPYTASLMACVPRRGQALGSIPGIVPTLIGEVSGCMFRNRCALADERCRDEEPALRESGSNHMHACLARWRESDAVDASTSGS